MQILINTIYTHPLTQGRIALNRNTLDEYQVVWAEGGSFPPIVVVSDPTLENHYWLADGYHRLVSLKNAIGTHKLDIQHINAEVKEGNLTDAIFIACGANAHHGLPRTPSDRLRQATIYFAQSSEWAARSNREIGKQLSISHTSIAAYRQSIKEDTIDIIAAYTKLPKDTIEAAKANLIKADGQPIVTTRKGQELKIDRKPSEPPKYAYTGKDKAIDGTVTQVSQSLTKPSEISVKDKDGKFHRVDRKDLANLPDEPIKVGDFVTSVEDGRTGRVLDLKTEAHDLKATVIYDGDDKPQKESVEFLQRPEFIDFLNNRSKEELLYYRELIDRLLSKPPS